MRATAPATTKDARRGARARPASDERDLAPGATAIVRVLRVSVRAARGTVRAATAIVRVLPVTVHVATGTVRGATGRVPHATAHAPRGRRVHRRIPTHVGSGSPNRRCRKTSPRGIWPPPRATS